jgi:hypothetical protein
MYEPLFEPLLKTYKAKHLSLNFLNLKFLNTHIPDDQKILWLQHIRETLQPSINQSEIAFKKRKKNAIN